MVAKLEYFQRLEFEQMYHLLIVLYDKVLSRELLTALGVHPTVARSLAMGNTRNKEAHYGVIENVPVGLIRFILSGVEAINEARRMDIILGYRKFGRQPKGQGGIYPCNLK